MRPPDTAAFAGDRKLVRSSSHERAANLVIVGDRCTALRSNNLLGQLARYVEGLDGLR
jgi:hypothetical protein